MAVPFFFEPYLVEPLPAGREEAWRDAGYEGTIPERAVFVDGGIVSNFPIGMFHGKNVPAHPTFGAKLNYYRKEPMAIDSPARLLAAMFYQAKNTLDSDFLARNKDYRRLVSYINTRDHGWLDFAMDQRRKLDLFQSGVQAAVNFLVAFDWPGYKKLRERLGAPALSTA